jgi:NitT/TauT family transport system substrate-binding protein
MKKMRNSYFPGVVAAMLIIGLVISAVWMVRKNQAKENPLPEKLTVGISRSDYSALITIAKDKGIFSKSGLDVSIVAYESGSEAFTQLIQDKLDLCAVAGSAFVIRSFGDDFDPDVRIVSTIATADIHEVVARKDRRIEGPSDLKGKRIGVTRKTSGELFLTVFLIIHQIRPTEVTVVDLPPGQLTEALARGELDAILAWDMHAHEAKERLGSVVVSWSAQRAFDFFWNVVAKEKLLRAKRSAIERFLRALVEAEKFVDNNPEEAKELNRRFWNRTPSYNDYIWSNMKLRVSLDQSLLVSMKRNAKILINTYYHGNSSPDYFPIIDTSLLSEIDPKRVRIFGR